MAESSAKIVITAEDKTSAAVQSAQKSIASLAASVTTMTGAFAAVGQVSLIAMVKTAVDAGDQLNKLSQRTGIAVESLSALEYAGRLSDVSLESLATGLKKLSVNMNEVAATGKGDAAAAFKAIGVEVTNSAGYLRSADDVLADVADRFSELEDGAGKTALAVAIFGKNGSEMIPLLNQGAKGLAAAREEAEKFGIIVGKDFAKASEEFNDNLTRMGEASRAFGLSIANGVLPWLIRMTNEFVEAKRQGIGLFEGIRNLGMVNPGNTPRQNIRNIDETLDKLKAAQEKDKPGSVTFVNRAGRISELERARAYFSARERDTAPQASYSNENRGIGSEKKKPAPKFGGGDTEKDQYTPLTQQIAEKSAQLTLEAESTDRLTEAQKFALKVMTDLQGGYLKLSVQQKINVTNSLEQMLAADQANQATEARRKALEQEAKALDEYFKEEEKARLLVEDFIAGTRVMQERVEQTKEMVGLRGKERAVIEASRKIEDEAQRKREQAFRDIKDPGLYAQKVEEINEALAIQKKRLAEATGEVYDYSRSWESGVRGAFASYLDEVDDMASKSSNLVVKSFRGMEDALVEFVKTGKQDFSSLADSIISDLIRIQVQQSITKPLAKSIEDSGGLFNSVKKIFGFANGGVMTSAGPVPLHAYAGGGIANSPQMALFGEGSVPEAFVPVPSGRIPVELRGGSGGSLTIQQYIYPAPGVNASDLSQAMVAAKNAAVAEVYDAQRRGRWS